MKFPRIPLSLVTVVIVFLLTAAAALAQYGPPPGGPDTTPIPVPGHGGPNQPPSPGTGGSNDTVYVPTVEIMGLGSQMSELSPQATRIQELFSSSKLVVKAKERHWYNLSVGKRQCPAYMFYNADGFKVFAFYGQKHTDNEVVEKVQSELNVSPKQAP